MKKVTKKRKTDHEYIQNRRKEGRESETLAPEIHNTGKNKWRQWVRGCLEKRRKKENSFKADAKRGSCNPCSNNSKSMKKKKRLKKVKPEEHRPGMEEAS